MYIVSTTSAKHSFRCGANHINRTPIAAMCYPKAHTDCTDFADILISQMRGFLCKYVIKNLTQISQIFTDDFISQMQFLV